MVADVHKYSAVAPIRFPDPRGAFPGDILLRPPPVVVDANVLRNDILRDAIVRSRPDGYIDPVSEVADPGLDPAPHPWLPDVFPAAGAALPASWDSGIDAADRVVRTMLRATQGTPGRAELREDLSQRLHEITAIRRAVDKYLAGSRPDR